MLNSKIGPRAVVGYGVKIFHPSPPNYVTRSPGKLSQKGENSATRFITSQYRNSLPVSRDTSTKNVYNFGRPKKSFFLLFKKLLFSSCNLYTQTQWKKQKRICFIYTLNLCLLLLQSWNFLTRVQDIFEDLAADRKIRSYTIKCPRRSRGCQWTDELRAKDVGLIYSCLKIPKRNFSIVSLIIRSIRKSSTNYANSYIVRQGTFAQFLNHVINDCVDVANLAKGNRVQVPLLCFLVLK